MVLPEGVRAVWDLAKAYREATPTRERVCINGLWRWQPAGTGTDGVPTAGWGYFKVPGPWPNSPGRGPQILYAHPNWARERLGEVSTAWYQREIQVPETWRGRRISVSAEYLNSHAVVYVDGQQVGEMKFPAGEVDLTAHCRPGQKHVLSMRVAALPLSALVTTYSQTDQATVTRGRVARRGLCGDVFLVATPQGARVEDVKVEPSVRRWQITFDAALQLEPGVDYALRARILDGGREVAVFTSRAFTSRELQNGRFRFTADWHPDKLWDVHTPQNMYTLELSLLGPGGRALDTFWPSRFGFREFWIEGRDFYLNGSRFFCINVPFENANRGPYEATYEATRETLSCLKRMGINTVFTHYYNCQPGAHMALGDVLRAADDVGMLISLSQPHFANYDWDATDAPATNGYAEHAAFYVRVAQNHPSVVFYSTSHNATGYNEDMNPEQIGNPTGERTTAWSTRNTERALKAEAIIRRLDNTRVIYHHSSGNLHQMYTSNFYLNFTPIQERSDWFGRWSREGVIPAFLVEYGPPLPPTWTMYRGWYKGKREYLSAKVPWELCTAEWACQFLGERAFELTEMEKADLRFEAEQFRAGRTWQRYAYPYRFNSQQFAVPNRCDVQAMYITDNWRAFRTWELSGVSGWSYDRFFVVRPDFSGEDSPADVDWDKLQRPGYSIDVIPGRPRLRDWVPNSAGEAFLRNSRPLLAYIGGKPGAFTSKDHNFLPGETVEKQLIIINNSRETVKCDCRWSLALPSPRSGGNEIELSTGEQARIPLSFELPRDLAPGQYEIRATVTFSTGETQQDAFTVDVLAPPEPVRSAARIALYDPKGDTAALLNALAVSFERVTADADLDGYDVLMIGKGALTLDGPAPEVSRVREGLRVVIFEQTGQVLERRFGFRTAEYGLRRVFNRIPDHPLLEGLSRANLHDWRGEATTLPPRLTYEMVPRRGPTVKWCDIPVTRAWRCGNRGNVASALIEKPACGDFLPILDGGYAFQYASLMEYREGRGMVLFCQTDVTGRTESDPAAELLVRNIVRYVSGWKPPARRTAVYVGEEAGRKHLEACGLVPESYAGGQPSTDRVLVVGPGGGKELAPHAAAIADWLRAGGRVLAIGLNEREANAFLPVNVKMRVAEHIAARLDPFGMDSPLAGISPAEVHNRDPRDIPLVTGGAEPVGDGVLATAEGGRIVFCQLAPWQFDYSGEKMNVKRTYRRVSCLVARLLGNMGVAPETPLLERVSRPVAQGRKRWLEGYYLDVPEEWDDPYRFFRW